MTTTAIQCDRNHAETPSAAPSVLLLHPTGNQFVRHALVGLHEAGLLAEFWTCIAWNSSSLINALLPRSFATELQRRSFPEIPDHIIRTQPWAEVGRLIAQRLVSKDISRNLTNRFSSNRVNQYLDRAVARRLLEGNLSGVYSYEDIALRSFLAAKQGRLACIYDLPIGYWRAYHEIMKEEAESLPEWAETLGGNRDTPEKLETKDRELALADVIVVASSFTQNTLSLYPRKLSAEIVRVPYGAPPVSSPHLASARTSPLRILFVGTLGQRKGISYLLDAVERLEQPYQLTLLGRPDVVPPPLQRALNQHRWIPSAPHAEVLRVMQEHDVLVFPSLFEGFGLVILEAMSQGLVVITTHHTAGSDVITDGTDGFLVPLRSASAITAVLTKLAEDRHLLASMSQAAQEKTKAFSWARYEREMILAVRRLLSSGPRPARTENTASQLVAQ